jgi:DNA-binding IscR family transcriptional regulator
MSKTYRFGIVSKNVLDDPQLSIQAKGLYSLLCTYANKQRECFPSRNTLADQLNISVRYVDTLIKELKNAGCMTRTGRTIKLK